MVIDNLVPTYRVLNLFTLFEETLTLAAQVARDRSGNDIEFELGQLIVRELKKLPQLSAVERRERMINLVLDVFDFAEDISGIKLSWTEEERYKQAQRSIMNRKISCSGFYGAEGGASFFVNQGRDARPLCAWSRAKIGLGDGIYFYSTLDTYATGFYTNTRPLPKPRTQRSLTSDLSP